MKSPVIFQPQQVNKETAKLRRHRKWGRNQAMALNQDLSVNKMSWHEGLMAPQQGIELHSTNSHKLNP